MRRGTFGFSACFVLCGAAGAVCGGENTYTDKKLRYQITVPNSFEDKSKEGTRYDISDDISEVFRAIVRVTELKEGESLRSFFADEWVRSLIKGTTLTSIRMIQVGGRTTINLTVKDNATEYMIYHAVSGRRSYTLGFSIFKEKLEKRAKEIDAIVNSFKILTDK